MTTNVATEKDVLRPQLLLSAGPDEFSALRSALLRLHRDHPDKFATLFAPESRSRRIDKLPPEQSWALLHFGLVARDESQGALVGRHRIRVLADRFYVMELGGQSEYFQDVWPETDALLAALERAQPGRLLDLGCGTGIVAIEGAHRGHRVVATDLYETALQLAQFNARLNGVLPHIAFRQGHQLEPLAGERFDLILTAPHYTRIADQLRVEVLQAAPAHLLPNGTLVVATMLEWQSGRPAIVDEVLRAHSQAGLSVRIEPLPTPYKREWFTVRRPSADLVGTASGDALVSRHRFLITMKAPAASPSQFSPAGDLDWQPPSADQIMIQPYVPLARLYRGPRQRPLSSQSMPVSATVASAADVDVMRRMLTSLDAGVMSLGMGGPFLLLDACRYGARRCVTAHGFDGAASAIFETGGTVRPCTHGQSVGRKEDTTATLNAALWQQSLSLRARRGCADCPVETHCSQCLFPFPLAEEAYCKLMRDVPRALPLLPRLAASLPGLAGWAANIAVSGELRIKVRRVSQLVAASGRPCPVSRVSPSENDRALAAQLDHFRKAWLQLGIWLAALGNAHFALLFAVGNRFPLVPISPLAAALAELVSDGATLEEVRDYLKMHNVTSQAADQALDLLFRVIQHVMS